jgi:DNA-binding NtrC family response regulator
MKSPTRVLFVDDQWCEPDQRRIIEAAYGALTTRDDPYEFHYETAEVSPGVYGVPPVMRRIESIDSLAAVILDVMFGPRGERLGLHILEAIRGRYPLLPVLIMTSLEREVALLEQAMELGANEYLVKKPSLGELEKALQLYTQPASGEAEYAMWGNSLGMRKVRAQLARVSVSGATSTLIVGESGTGKELVARAVHRQGPRRFASFVAPNCANHHGDLLNDELFGHEEGAFTGANRRRVGLLERADKGVLFLDEVGLMPHHLQEKLLRVLAERTFERLGGNEAVKSDFQLVCATNEEPERLLASGLLRRDFYFRVCQVEIRVPPLRERRDDIPILAEWFLSCFRQVAGASYPGRAFSDAAIAALQSHEWPGNVRELRNVVERAVILSRHERLEVQDLRLETGLPRPSAIGPGGELGDDPATWPDQRLECEIRIALSAKSRIQAYKGANWRAEFMRRLYPHCKASNAKGFDDLIKRLSRGPWGNPDMERDPRLKALLDELRR